MTEGLSHDQVKNVHQNPLQFVRTDKETELLDLVAKDDRFRGMMELYGLFRNLIAQEHISKDGSVRSTEMQTQLTQLQSKLSYVENAMGILVKHLQKAELITPPESKIPGPGQHKPSGALMR